MAREGAWLVGVLAVCGVAGLLLRRPAPPPPPPPVAVQAPTPTPVPHWTPVTRLRITDLVMGHGLRARAGNRLSVRYTGWLPNGKKFDSSDDHGGRPFDFVLGKGMVISGWEHGFLGMRVGGKRRLEIPPSDAYGDRAVGPIPPNSTLIFEVELLAINPPDTAASGQPCQP